MGDNEEKQGTAHRSPGIYSMTEENPEKPQLGGPLKDVPRHRIKLGPLPRKNRTTCHGEKERRDQPISQKTQ